MLQVQTLQQKLLDSEVEKAKLNAKEALQPSIEKYQSDLLNVKVHVLITASAHVLEMHMPQLAALLLDAGGPCSSRCQRGSPSRDCR